MGRAGRWAKQRAREHRWKFVRDRLPFLAAVAAGYVVMMFGIVLLLRRSSLEFWVSGIAVGLLWLMDRLLFLDGAQWLRDGADAEKWTSSALRKLNRFGWSHVDHLPLRWGNVDHVLFGPDGVVTVETKYTNAEWRIENGRLKGAFRNPPGQARDGKRKVERMLQREGIEEVGVTSALVVWGSRTQATSIGFIEPGVLLLPGHLAGDWHQHLPVRERPLEPDTLRRIEGILCSHMPLETGPVRRVLGRVPLVKRIAVPARAASLH